MSQGAYTTVRACPICGTHRAVALHEQRFVLPEGSPLPPAYTVASCANCGACFADTPAPQAAYELHYEQFSKYDDPALGTGGGASCLDRDRLAETATLLAGQPLPHGTASRVLDIGCAGGGLLMELAERGFHDLAGMDPSRACVERVRRLGFTCQQGKLSDLPSEPPPKPYNVVILSHVVEHLVDVRSALRGVHTLLAKGGICYIEVPDASRYTTEAFVPFYFFDSEHINHCSLDTLRNMACANAFDTLSGGPRDLRLEGGRLYPAIWAMLRKADAPGSLLPETGLRAALAEYIGRSSAPTDEGWLNELAENGCPVLLWGAGQHAQRLLQRSPLARCNLVGIVDRDPGKQGRVLSGQTIEEPDATLAGLAADVVIVIASVLHGDQIAASIAERGLPNRAVVAR